MAIQQLGLVPACSYMESLVMQGGLKMVTFSECAFMFLGMALYFGISWRRAATNMIKEIGTWSRYYPKQYIVPPKWMKSFFHIERRIIPRFLYFELLLSLFFLASGPINLMICIVAHYEKVVAGFLVFSCVCLSLINTIFFLITSFFFKKK